MDRRVPRYFYFECAFGTVCDRILYDALEGRKVASADWADPANRCPEYGGGMEETFGKHRDLEEKVPESNCKIQMGDRHAFHERYCDEQYGSKIERDRQDARWDW